MPSERPSPSLKPFDPARLAKYTVINVPLRQLNGEKKLVVVLSHRDAAAICIKATSKSALFSNDADKLAGVVFYRAGTACFQKDTFVQPDNRFAVFHADIDSEACVVGCMPDDFHDRLVLAIRASKFLNARERKAMLLLIGEPGAV